MSLEAHTGPPVLPVELEREIFEMVARSRLQTIPTLMLVASRVKIWVEPLLYRTLLVTDAPGPFPAEKEKIPVLAWETCQSIFSNKPISFLNHSVRNVFLYISDDMDLTWFLNTCSQIENLFIHGSHSRQHLPAIAPLPIKQLQCSLHRLFPLSRINFTHPLFSHLTHLFDCGGIYHTINWSGLAVIPHLTHLAFCNIQYIPFFLGFFDTCKSLRVLVYVDEERKVMSHDVDIRLAEDSRFVAMISVDICEDWVMGEHTGVDFWSKAEDFIARRKSGQVPALQFRLTEAN
ncbi:hypothetical protein C8R43DRAFT_596341 [Mycena crocata]|nr:hypothetical protein C8R43DRAFT_596341 [Mycena crocata]